MKRDRFASDYEQVRRQAGLPRAEFDLPEPGAKPDLARVHAAHDDFKARMAVRTEHEAEEEANRKAAATELTLRANESIRVTEFVQAGVEQPIGMLVSIGMLMQLGWTIAEVDGKKMLVRPTGKPRARKTREEYAADSIKDGF
jgi:hypothetical protein